MKVALGVVIVGALWGVDRVARALGLYADADDAWPAGWRAVPLPAATGEGPYREGERVRWERAVEGGLPRAVSLFLAPAVGIGLLWTIAVPLALGDIVRATHPMGRALASLTLCVVRATSAWAVVGAAAGRDRARFAAWLAGALALDLALALLPLPCSDHRDDDLRMAANGLAVDLLLAGGFALSAWRRRGLVARDPAAAARMN